MEFSNKQLVVTVFTKLSHGTEFNDTAPNNLFAVDLYCAVVGLKADQNVVVSPAVVQTSMALTYYGAKGQTATELIKGLRLDSNVTEEMIRSFGEFQKNFTHDNYIHLSNQIYINDNLEFRGKFKEFAQQNFDSNIEKADFHPPYNVRTTERINKAVEKKTNGKVTDILESRQLDNRTEAIIVIGVSFSAPWQKAFRADRTTKRDFSAGKYSQVYKVDTMWSLNNYKYGEFSDLDATAVELPYQNVDYSMIVILPNSSSGWRSLIKSLPGKNLVTLLNAGMKSQEVEIYLPKFSVSFGVNLQEPFSELGIKTMFRDDGDFDNMYLMFTTHHINSVIHKTYIEVTEDGTPQSLKPDHQSNSSQIKKFDANHPFVFAIKHKESIILMGHIANNHYVYNWLVHCRKYVNQRRPNVGLNVLNFQYDNL
uniref:Serpin domain-containing protein n=1 Tax=Glossina brevipalpis TaxID=37001 RepID=A0A1A9W155_9MUSC